MKIPKDAKRNGRRLFRGCFTNEQFDEARARAMVDGIVRAKPRHMIAILSVFQRLVRLEMARNTAHIESATALPADQQASVQQRLQQFYRRPLTTEFRVSAALIGGTRITVGSDVWDGSVANRLETLRTVA
ncbi:MAG: H(+)-transporting ATPase [Verrucomicrobiae bacterium]|nr:H(+)-transporting ATPase [Verrucomicrobiae bacterium]